MKNGRHHALVLAFLLSIMMLGVQPVASQSAIMTPAQIVEPFEEMLPGVYVATEWWNQSSDDYDWGIPEPTDASAPSQDYDDYEEYVYYYEVEDIYGDVYYIEDNSTYDYDNDWEYNNLLVVVILDPDASFMSWLVNYDWSTGYVTEPYPEDPNNLTMTDSEIFLPSQDYDEELSITNLWTLFWNPPAESLTGDEVFVFSSFYYDSFNYSFSMDADYIWYNDEMDVVNANDVIPNLTEEYEWVSYMNESWSYADDWSFSYFGYDISEMVLNGDQVEWMNHYFSGMSAFNDTNDNGIMDIVYNEVEIDFDEDGIIDWTYYEMDPEESELVYDFYSSGASIGDIKLPYLNDDDQIEWSAEVVDVTGDLWTFSPMDVYSIEYMYDEPINGTDPFEVNEPIPAEVENLEMVYRFEVTDEAAVIKIDQHIGDFTDPDNGLIISELEGLGLTMNYWSSFSSYGLDLLSSNSSVDYSAESGAEVQDEIGVSPDTDEFVTINFGGTYVWGADDGTYDVGTAVMPGQSIQAFAAEPGVTGVQSDASSFSYTTYYYSSCYSNWDGYAITHDPIYAVYPNVAPGGVSAMIDAVIVTAFAVGVLGILAMVGIFFRIHTLRKTQ
ncbi:MAG: hypothetical protein ACTSUB_01875 [Candidatus Thorarchaeota archaeon]